MLKKIFTGLMAAAMLFTTSCENQEQNSVVGGEATVTINVGTPEIATRAYSDGMTANKLQYAVYHMNDTQYGTISHETTDVDLIDGTTTLSLQLTAGETYQIILWADAEDAPYTVNFEEKTMIVDYTNVVSNNESLDAFYAVHKFTVNGAQTETVELRRPFAQLNIGTNDYDEAKTASNYQPKQSSVKVKGIYNTLNLANGTVSGGDDAYVTFADALIPTGETFPVTGYEYVAMNYVLVGPESVGDEGKCLVDVEFAVAEDNGANPKTRTVSSVPVQRNYRTNIYGSILTSDVDVNVEINPDYEEEDTNNNDVVLVATTEEAQAALDNAVEGTTIQLQPYVNYGTLYMRPIDGGAQTNVVDWLGNNYRFETYSLFENITIIGAKGATIDAIEIEGGTYYNTEHSQKDQYPVMLSLVELKNVVFDGVTFTGKGGYDPQGHGNAVNLSGNNIKVDGLTFKNCVLNNTENNARLLYKTESTTHVHNYSYDGETYTFSPSLKDITITDCTLNGGYMGLELRETENVTITNNEFNVADRNILLAVNTGCTYSGIITITGNVSNNAQERFVRADGTGDAEVIITGNTINNYLGADADYIKVTGGNNVTIENNVLGVSNAAALQHLCNKIATGTTLITLTDDISGDVTVIQKPGVKITIDGQKPGVKTTNKKYTYNGSIKVHSNSNYYDAAALTIMNLNFETSTASVNFIEALENGSERYSSNITVENCTFNATGEAVNTAVGVQVKATRGVTVKNCTATNMHSLIQAQSCDTGDVKVIDCKVNGKNGVAFKQVKTAVVEGTTITATGYGIRFDGNIDNYGITVNNNTVTAAQPFIVRKMTGQNNTIALEGTNKLTTNAEYQIVITNGSDDEAYVKPTGTYTLTGADNYLVYPRDYAHPVASWDEFTAALAAGEAKIKLTGDVVNETVESFTINQDVVINLNQKAFELTSASAILYTGDKKGSTPKVTFKNGKINNIVYGLSGDLTLTDIVFGGTVTYLSAAQGVINTKSANLLAVNCKMTNVNKSGSTKPRTISVEGRTSGYIRLIDCNLSKSGVLDRAYFWSIGGTTILELKNCVLYTTTLASNIDFSGTYSLCNVDLANCKGGFTFGMNRASTSLTEEELAIYRAIKQNNTGSMRFLFSDGEKNNL